MHKSPIKIAKNGMVVLCMLSAICGIFAVLVAGADVLSMHPRFSLQLAITLPLLGGVLSTIGFAGLTYCERRGWIKLPRRGVKRR